MRIPKKPPDITDQQLKIFSSPEKFDLIRNEGIKAEREGKYRHWDILRHLSPPTGLTVLEWWAGIKMQRLLGCKEIPLWDRNKGDSFFYTLTDDVTEQLHSIDFRAGGAIEMPTAVVNVHTRDQHIIHSLTEEAITSSQIEGATTTRRVAKDMLRSGRTPRDKSEQMILNNYRTMQQIRNWKDVPLTKELVFEIHSMITDGTLEKPDASGRFRTENEVVIIEDASTGDVLHEPPPAPELEERLKAMCDFANGKTPGQFVHPIIRAIMCDRYVVKLEGESPLRALVRRTVREGKGVRRETESEESRIQNTDLTNRKCIKAGVLRIRVHKNPKSNTYSEGTNVFATG